MNRLLWRLLGAAAAGAMTTIAVMAWIEFVAYFFVMESDYEALKWAFLVAAPVATILFYRLDRPMWGLQLPRKK